MFFCIDVHNYFPFRFTYNHYYSFTWSVNDQFFTVLTTSDLIKPGYLFNMTRNIYHDVNGFLRPSYSTNFTSELTKTLEQINLNPEELSSLSTSLLQSSNVLNDLPVVVQVYPSEEVRVRCQKFRADVRKLSKNLRQGYKHTWKTFLQSRSFMEAGAVIVKKIQRKALENQIDSARSALVTLLENVSKLLEHHQKADKLLESIYEDVNDLANEAKRSSHEYAEEMQNLHDKWNVNEKLAQYGFLLMYGAFTGNFMVTLSGVGGFWHIRCNRKR
eukprot:UN01917